MSNAKPKIYAFCNGGSPGWYEGIGIAEDGTCLASHICSAEYFVPGDLGATTDWKHDIYAKHYPDGFEVEFVPTKDVETHAGLQEAFRLNSLQAEAEA